MTREQLDKHAALMRANNALVKDQKHARATVNKVMKRARKGLTGADWKTLSEADRVLRQNALKPRDLEPDEKVWPLFNPPVPSADSHASTAKTPRRAASSKRTHTSPSSSSKSAPTPPRLMKKTNVNEHAASQIGNQFSLTFEPEPDTPTEERT